jgi:hypothetical protein
MPARTEMLPILDPIAFAGALILAPPLVAALTFWLLLIPIVAVGFGAVPYLVFGTPVFLWMVTRYPVTSGNFALGGLLAHALFALSFALWSQAQPYPNPEMVGFYALWGIPFSAAWGVAFAYLYRCFCRPLIP